jgi:beta-glucanase (GH16 family)
VSAAREGAGGNGDPWREAVLAGRPGRHRFTMHTRPQSRRVHRLARAGVSVALAALVSVAAAEVGCPLKHGQWETLPALTDEFAGDRLDESKWFPNNPGWLGRPPGYFNPRNVRLAGGMLHLDAKKESLPDLPAGYHTYTTAFVKGKTRVRYGYFEIRARAMDSHASSAFWFYDRTPEAWSEIDVFEIGARPQPTHYYMNTHLFHTLVETVHWHKSRIWEAPYPLAREFHVYGLEWDPEVLRFTVDGAVVREERNSHWHQPLALCFDSETFPDWFGLPQDDALPATFSIDYIRAWKRKDGPPDQRPDAVEFAFPGRSGSAEAVYRMKLEEGGTLAVKATGGAERPDRVHLEYVNDAFFASQQAAEIEKRLTLQDQDGKVLTVLMAWSRTEPWKREGRERAGEEPGSPNPRANGYHPVGVDVRPLPARPRGTVQPYRFETESGAPIRITVRH